MSNRPDTTVPLSSQGAEFEAEIRRLRAFEAKSHALAGRHRTSMAARRDLAEAREEAIRAAAKTLRQHVIPALEESGVHIADCLRGDAYVDAALFRELARLVRQIAPPRPRTVTEVNLSGARRLAACAFRAAARAEIDKDGHPRE